MLKTYNSRLQTRFFGRTITATTTREGYFGTCSDWDVVRKMVIDGQVDTEICEDGKMRFFPTDLWFPADPPSDKDED